METDSTAAEPPEGGGRGRRDVTQGALLGIAVAALVLLGIGLTVGFTRGDSASDEWAGQPLVEPREKPPIALTDTDGEKFDMRAETAGQVTVLFFGYTNCPDICPPSLTNLDKALESMPANVRANTAVVFVTVDPRRDTPKVLRAFLDSFDPSFVGLTGTPQELRQAQDLAGIPRSTFDEPNDDGFYLVGHSSEMIAYAPDGTADLVYSFRTRQSDWARDLPRLVDGERPSQ